jgi:hypothetical protein
MGKGDFKVGIACPPVPVASTMPKLRIGEGNVERINVTTSLTRRKMRASLADDPLHGKKEVAEVVIRKSSEGVSIGGISRLRSQGFSKPEFKESFGIALALMLLMPGWEKSYIEPMFTSPRRS